MGIRWISGCSPMMSASRDVPERPVPATKTGEGEGDMASSQTPSPAPVQSIYPLQPLSAGREAGGLIGKDRHDRPPPHPAEADDGPYRTVVDDGAGVRAGSRAGRR
ncbi:hypothetical protein F6X68_04020 [Micromonospora sp. AMSO12t]|nr:hypothetical protein F6X68_04020 [Micromonospora sp. AMSO12t]